MTELGRTSWISLRDVLDLVFRHKRKILLFFVLVVAATAVWTFVIVDKMYQSEARLLVRLGRENLSMDPSVSGPTVSMTRDRESEINSEVAIFTNRQLAEEVVAGFGEMAFLEPGEKKTGWRKALSDIGKTGVRLVKQGLVTVGLLEPLTDFEKAVLQVTDNLQVETERRANILDVRFDAATPSLAHDALERLLQGYMDRHIKAYSAQASPQFFEEQAEQLRGELGRREAVLQEYQVKNNIASLEQQKQVLLQQVSDAEKQLGETVAQASGSQARVEALDKSLSSHSRTRELSRTTGRTNSAADSLKVRLADLKIKEADLAARYPDTHQPLIDLRQQVAEIEQALGKEEATHTEVTTGVDVNFQELELNLQMERAQMVATQARKTALEAELARLRDKVAQLASLEFTYNDMKRDAALAEQEYMQYRDNLQRSRISVALDQDKVSNISIVQAATMPMEPVKPQKKLNMAFGVVLGIIGGIGLALLAEYLDDTIRGKADAERRLGVPVLVEISAKDLKECI